MYYVDELLYNNVGSPRYLKQDVSNYKLNIQLDIYIIMNLPICYMYTLNAIIISEQ